MVLDALGHVPFRPLRIARHGWTQTILGRYWPDRTVDGYDEQHVVPLADGDALAVIENRPASWRPQDRTVVLVHGLAGCSGSSYMIRLSRLLCDSGDRVMRVNLRGCGPGLGLARHLYHSGRSEDVRAVLEWLAKVSPHSPVTLIGFSLGANITLKLVGEDGSRPSGRMDSFAAVSPPLNLSASATHMNSSRLNRVFERYFVSEVVAHARALHRHHPELGPPPEFPSRLTLREFDDFYTGPRSGFASGAEYYSKCSSQRFLHEIRVPGLVLYSWDDPVIDSADYRNRPHNPSLHFVLTDGGGHVGFLGPDGRPGGVRWMDRLLLKWLAHVDGRDRSGF